MQKIWGSRHLRNAFGYALVTFGLVGDGITGILLLATGNPQVLLLHIVAALVWGVGVNIVSNSFTLQASTIRIGRVRLNRWSATALCLSLLPFPGLATFAYSIAIVVAGYSRERVIEEMPEIVASTRAMSLPLNLEIQPLIDILSSSDLEMKRAAVSVLSQQANPESVRLLRQLLSDTHAELRSDASIALTRLEDELSRVLNASLARWVANPQDKEYTRALADDYYSYACSNVLDEVSQQSYLVKALDLVGLCLAQDEMDAQLWLNSARIRQRLGQAADALAYARRAIELDPDGAEGYVFAMEVAFDLHAWNVLLELARQGLRVLPSTSNVREALQSWVTLHEEQLEGVLQDVLR